MLMRFENMTRFIFYTIQYRCTNKYLNLILINKIYVFNIIYQAVRDNVFTNRDWDITQSFDTSTFQSILDADSIRSEVEEVILIPNADVKHDPVYDSNDSVTDSVTDIKDYQSTKAIYDSLGLIDSIIKNEIFTSDNLKQTNLNHIDANYDIDDNGMINNYITDDTDNVDNFINNKSEINYYTNDTDIRNINNTEMNIDHIHNQSNSYDVEHADTKDISVDDNSRMKLLEKLAMSDLINENNCEEKHSDIMNNLYPLLFNKMSHVNNMVLEDNMVRKEESSVEYSGGGVKINNLYFVSNNDIEIADSVVIDVSEQKNNDNNDVTEDDDYDDVVVVGNGAEVQFPHHSHDQDLKLIVNQGQKLEHNVIPSVLVDESIDRLTWLKEFSNRKDSIESKRSEFSVRSI